MKALSICTIACRNARVWGVSEAAPGRKPTVVKARLGGKRDPGYWETSRMLLESGLCLALQVQRHVCIWVSVSKATSLVRVLGSFVGCANSTSLQAGCACLFAPSDAA